MLGWVKFIFFGLLCLERIIETQTTSGRVFRVAVTAAYLAAVGMAITWAWKGLTHGPAIEGGAGHTRTGAERAMDGKFVTSMKPFFETYCYSCHSGMEPKGGLDLTYESAQKMERDSDRFALMVEKLKGGQMPPLAAPKQPKQAERVEAAAFVSAYSRMLAERDAGDPGQVLAHRLSNAEYNYVIRDLTGVDIQPAKEFPVDPANQAGFDNTGESLNMEPELLKKYMEAARFVADHMVLKSDGLGFSPDPAISETDRDKYSVNRVIAFYEKQPTDISFYFLATWRYQNRAALGQPNSTLEDFGADFKLSQKYLKTLWRILNDDQEKVGPIAALQAMWRAMPVPDGKNPDASGKACDVITNWVYTLRAAVRPVFPNLQIPGMQTGSQPFVIWKDQQYEKTRMTYAEGSALKLKPEILGAGTAGAEAMKVPTIDGQKPAYEDAFKRFCAVFPDAFYIPERTRMYEDPAAEERANRGGRLLSAGLHSQTGYFRDDRPLYELILDKDQQAELDAMWKDFDMITDAPTRQFQSMIWFERSDSRFMKTPEFNFIRTEDKDLGQEPKFSKFREVFRTSAQAASKNPVPLQAIEDYFDTMNATFRAMDANRAAAEPTHLAALQDFAARAYRRPLTQAEKESILAFYKKLRNDDQLSHEDAVRDTLVSILMSPHFCYRYTALQAKVEPLTDLELASRLSFFLWSSIPDAELMKHATAGDLHDPAVMTEQANRMMKDPRVAAMAIEFGGNWLDFRRFEEHNGVDRERFKTFDNNLREAMFEEPIRFIEEVVQNDRSVLDFVYGDYTFVNAQLAKHYGMPFPKDKGEWVKVEKAQSFDRGGLLPMAVFMTKNAPGLRTSPVKRGYWVVKRLLGEEIPAPPPNVPVLPTDESKLGDLTFPQLLAAHRADPNCATCHIHFDAVGLAFEGYGPIGEVRKVDGGGKPVQNKATFIDGSEGTGIEGLRAYIKGQREHDFLENLSRKLLANALGRTLILSDDLLVEKMLANLNANRYRFSSLVDTIVTSPQFLNKRSQENSARKVN